VSKCIFIIVSMAPDKQRLYFGKTEWEVDLLTNMKYY